MPYVHRRGAATGAVARSEELRGIPAVIEIPQEKGDRMDRIDRIDLELLWELAKEQPCAR